MQNGLKVYVRKSFHESPFPKYVSIYGKVKFARCCAQPETARALLIAITGYGQESDRVQTPPAGLIINWSSQSSSCNWRHTRTTQRFLICFCIMQHQVRKLSHCARADADAGTSGMCFEQINAADARCTIRQTGRPTWVG